jgi:hypothetical protein
MAQATAQACADCGTTRREVQWSRLAGRLTCLSCYLAYAPEGPKRTPYRRPKPPPPTPRALMSGRVKRLLEPIAPVVVRGYDVAGTCPLCRHSLLAYVGQRATALVCSNGCEEKYIWAEFEL